MGDRFQSLHGSQIKVAKDRLIDTSFCENGSAEVGEPEVRVYLYRRLLLVGADQAVVGLSSYLPSSWCSHYKGTHAHL